MDRPGGSASASGIRARAGAPGLGRAPGFGRQGFGPAVRHRRVPSVHAQSTRRRDEPLPPAAREQPGRLVPVGAGCPGSREAPRSAHLPVHRVRRLSLVPRHGARVVRGRGHGTTAQRAIHLDQGGPGGASGPRFDLHGRRPGHDGLGWLAHVRVPDPGRGAVLRRDLLPRSPPPRDALVRPGARWRLAGLDRTAGRCRRCGRAARRFARGGCTRRCRGRWSGDRPGVVRRGGRRPARPDSIPPTGRGAARPSSRSR